MIRYILTLLLTLSLIGCEDTNILVLTDAASDAVTAITLSDEDVSNLARQAAAESDSRHQLAPAGSAYDKRLRSLLAPYSTRDGYTFDIRVYLTREVNAFAMADGTIRVYSGLMDLMTDQELLFVIGHEMGHVVEQHSRKKVVMAYASSAVRKGLASQENEIGQIARSVIGSFAQQLTNAQFSQHEERQADNYGVRFLLEEGYPADGAVSALTKLAELAKRHTFLSSHPAPEERAKRIKRGEYTQLEDERSLVATVFDYAKRIVFWLIDLVLAFIKWVFSLF